MNDVQPTDQRKFAATLIDLGRTHKQAYPADVAGYLTTAGTVILHQADRIADLERRADGLTERVQQQDELLIRVTEDVITDDVECEDDRVEWIELGGESGEGE